MDANGGLIGMDTEGKPITLHNEDNMQRLWGWSWSTGFLPLEQKTKTFGLKWNQNCGDDPAMMSTPKLMWSSEQVAQAVVILRTSRTRQRKKQKWRFQPSSELDKTELFPLFQCLNKTSYSTLLLYFNLNLKIKRLWKVGMFVYPRSEPKTKRCSHFSKNRL